MNVYLASRYARRLELLEYAREIESASHTVTARWIRGTHHADTESELTHKSAQFAQEDIEDIKRSDVLIAFTESPDVAVAGATRGGRHVELGLAIMLWKKIIIVGPVENIFCGLPSMLHYPDWETFRAKWLAGSVKYEPSTEGLYG